MESQENYRFVAFLYLPEIDDSQIIEGCFDLLDGTGALHAARIALRSRICRCTPTE